MEKLDGHLRDLIERHIAANGVQHGRRRYHPSSLTNHVQRHALRIVDPIEIKIEGATWYGVKVVRGFERRVASELTVKGFRAYCPVGKKNVTWSNGRRAKEAQLKIFAKFAPYIFVGCPRGLTLQKGTVDRIDSILRKTVDDVRIYHEVPHQSIEIIREVELSGVWDETIFRADELPFQPGDSVKIIAGALAGFPAILHAWHESGRVDLSVHIFGRESDVQLDACQIGAT